ncbi:MAG: MBL fold metallo-hydrolase [Patulibacter minatonensis]
MARAQLTLSAAGHAASFAQFLRRRAAREAADSSTLRDLAAVPLPLPAGLELEWLGTAGYRLTYEGCTLLIDPYLSRVPLGDVLRRRVALPDPTLQGPVLDADLGQVVGVLVGHTHFDHAIDVPSLARATGAPAYGSDSLVRLMALHGLADRAVEVEPRRAYELGPFTVTFVPSLHSKLLLGFAVPSDGALSCEHLDHLSPGAYKCGGIYGIRVEVGGAVLYHQGSANLIDDEVPTGGVDVFLAGIAGRRFTDDYWPRILRRLDPEVVVASHFDDFFRPLAAPLGFSTNVNLSAFPDEIAEVSRDIRVAALAPRRTPARERDR